MYLPAFFFLFISCSTDSETPEDNPDDTVSLIGKWYFTMYIDEEGEEPATDCDSNDFIAFNEDDTFNFAYHYIEGQECVDTGDQTGEWTLLEDGILELVYSEIETREVKYLIEENTLTLTIDEGLGEYREKYIKEE